MLNFWYFLAVAVANGLIRVVASAAVMKLVLTVATYAFLFVVLPALVSFLVPPELLGAVNGYISFLQSDTIGRNVAYFLHWFQFGTLLEVMLTALAVRFLFRRI
jgi:hypothetical protein